MARRNPKGSREIAVLNLVDGAITPQLLENGKAIVLEHESRHMDKVRDLLDDLQQPLVDYDDLTDEEKTARMEADWVVGYFYEGLSYRDLEARYGYSHEHIRRTIFRILGEMRERLEERHGEWEDTVE